MVTVAASLLCWPNVWADSHPYYLRNHSPFLQVFGLPAPEGGQLVEPGASRVRVAFSLANHADTSEAPGESVVLDGESYYTDVTWRYAPAPRWEIGVDVPYLAHRNGQLDNLIEGWHEAFGLYNGQRRGPSNHLQLAYTRDGIVHADLRHGSSGIGDIRLTGAYQLYADPADRRSLALRTTVKLPTGDAGKLRGSGATDMAVSFDATDELLLERWSMDVFAQAGGLFPGGGELLPDLQKRVVPFASLGLAWPWRRNIDLRAQLALQGEYFDSRLPDLGAGTASLAAGATWRLTRLGLELDLALIEDLISDATPDFGLYLSIASIGGRSTMPDPGRPGG